MSVRASWLLLIPSLAFADSTVSGDRPTERAAREAPPPSLVYAAPDREGPPDPAAVKLSEWKPGARLALLDGGEPVEVLEVEPARALHSGQVNHFYRVRGAGGERRIFGAALTPLAFTVGGELITVGFGADFKISVRGRGGAVELTAAGGPYLSRRGGDVEGELIDARVAGLPLVRLSSRPEACSDWWQAWVSVVDGKPRVALEVSGLMDPPSFSDPKVSFDAKRGTATLVQSSGELDERGRHHVRRRTTRYRLIKGVFVERKS